MSALSGNILFAPVPKLSRRWDARSMRVALMIGAVAILNVIDLVFTLFAQRIGMLNEMNPLTEVFLREGLMPSFICFKVLMVVCGLGIIWKTRHSRLALPACWVLFVAYVWRGVVWCEWVGAIIRIYNDYGMSG